MTTAKVQLNISVDPQLKKEAEVLCKALGLNVTVAVNMFLHQLVANQAFPFLPEVKQDPFFTEDDIRIIDQRYADYKAGREKAIPFVPMED